MIYESHSLESRRTFIATGGRDGRVRLWGTADRKPADEFYGKGHGNMVTSVAFSPDGKFIASGSHDDTVILWDAPTGQRAEGFEAKEHGGSVECVAFSPDGRFIASNILRHITQRDRLAVCPGAQETCAGDQNRDSKNDNAEFSVFMFFEEI